MKNRFLIASLLFPAFAQISFAQKKKETKKVHRFTIEKQLKTTPVKDLNGSRYYLVKNSRGTDLNKAYFYASKPFVQYKTISVLLHKDALPAETAKKLRIN